MTTRIPVAGPHPALDLLNTRRPPDLGGEDLLDTPEAAAAWLARVARLSPEELQPLRSSPPLARRALEETLRLREAVAALVEAFARGTVLPDAGVFALDRVLRARSGRRRVEARGTRLSLLDATERELPLGLLSGIAEAAAELLSTGERERLRQCAAEGCGLWFYDVSRNGRRRWCSMSRCGNRAKVAAHHRRRRA